MSTTTTTYDPKKAAPELDPGCVYYQLLPDGGEDWFTVAGKKKHSSGQTEYALISATFGRQHLKDNHENYKHVRARCRKWDVANQCVIEEDSEPQVIEVKPISVGDIENELGI